MTYGLDPRLFVEQGPAVEADRATRSRSTRSFQAWRAMDEEQRLKLVNCALRPCLNDNLPDGFPVAL